MLHNGTKKLFDYWNEIRGEHPAPSRVEVSPASIAEILPSTFILEQNAKQDFVFRLAGTAICMLFGEELKGHQFKNLIDIDDRNITSRLLSACHSEKIGVKMELNAIADGDRSVCLEVLLLPLSDEQPRILGSIHTLDMPYWVGAEAITNTTIKNIRILDADVELFSLHNRPSISMHQRHEMRRKKLQTPRFAVLQGGSMLGGPQTNRYGKTLQGPKFEVFNGGRS